jgi:Est1 DNA/RNA binding domain
MECGKELVFSSETVWMECLGDLARYRMAIDEKMHVKEVWKDVARMWYDQAADKSPNVGSVQHHLGVLVRPNIVQQLFYYSKALISVQILSNARDSMTSLFKCRQSNHSSQFWPPWCLD